MVSNGGSKDYSYILFYCDDIFVYLIFVKIRISKVFIINWDTSQLLFVFTSQITQC